MPVTDFDPREDGYASAFLKGTDFADGPAYLTIGDVTRMEFRDGTRKLALSFNDGSECTVNKTNYRALAAKFGEDPNGWIGRTVLAMAGPAYQGKPSLVLVPQADQTKLKPPRRPAPAAPAPADNPFDAEDGTDTGEVPF